jgi:addiction module RelB/DinJ family antitoxin
MPASALVQTRIDPAVKERAAAVLEELGITVSDAVRILLTCTANEGALPFELIKTTPRTTLGSGQRFRKRLSLHFPRVLQSLSSGVGAGNSVQSRTFHSTPTIPVYRFKEERCEF